MTVSALSIAIAAATAAELHHVLTYETLAGTAVLADSLNLHRLEIDRGEAGYRCRIANAGTPPGPWTSDSLTATAALTHAARWLEVIHR